jgi:hypothetical protein
MSIKEQNKQLTALKSEFQDTLNALFLIQREAEEILGLPLSEEFDEKANVVQDYLQGYLSMKGLRAGLKM